MAVPCTGILDNFDRPDGPLGANWSLHPDAGVELVISGGQAVVPVGESGGNNYWNVQKFGCSCSEAFGTLATLPDSSQAAALYTCLNISTFDSWQLQVVHDDPSFGDFLTLVSGTRYPITLTAGDKFLLRILTTTAQAWQKPAAGPWFLVVEEALTGSLSPGYLGMWLQSGAWEDFGGGDLSYECCGVVPPTPPYPAAPPTGPSFYQQTGLSIIATDPLLAANRSTEFRRLSDQIQTFHMEKRAIGGYWSAQANINMRSDEVEDWIERGLGRHVQVVDEALCQVWEGFVNRIEAKLGKLTFTLGPLLDIGNQVAYVYSTVDNTTNPPTVGARAKTAYADDLDSQATYGIIQRVQSEGGSTATLAVQNRDTFLVEHAWPPTGRRSTLLGGSPGDLTIEMLGYWHWLTVYVYNQTQLTGEIDLDAKLTAILNATPNYPDLFSIDYARITPNAVQVPQYENDDRTAEDLILGLNALGDAANGRMNIGFYNGRQLVYEPAPTFIRYVQRVMGNDLLTDLIGGNVRPWSVEPGQWIFYADFLSGRLPPITVASLKQDPRCGFVETVTLDNLYGLDINGIHVGTLDQMLAKQGLAGEGA